MSAHADLIKKIIATITKAGGVAFHVFTGLLKSGNYCIHGAEDGTFDVIGIYKGTFLAFDAKVGADVLSDKQINFAKNVRDNGGVAIAVYHIDTVKEVLHSIDTVNPGVLVCISDDGGEG